MYASDAQRGQHVGWSGGVSEFFFVFLRVLGARAPSPSSSPRRAAGA
jgi:hypothetical protein